MTGRSIVAAGAVVVAAAGLGACADRTNTTVGRDTATVPTAAAPYASSYPYALYTHCGITEANIAGRWYAADKPLSDGNGNPPPGWGNPYQPGTITIRSATQADFTDRAGHRVTFTLRPGATGPRQICS
jgi:hypothetical protein